jgi:hypothetical protein
MRTTTERRFDSNFNPNNPSPSQLIGQPLSSYRELQRILAKQVLTPTLRSPLTTIISFDNATGVLPGRIITNNSLTDAGTIYGTAQFMAPLIL